MPLTHLYTRLRVSLARFVLVGLLERNASGLEALAEDISNLLLNKNRDDYSTILFDYFEMLEEDPCFDETGPEELQIELEELLFEIIFSVSRYSERMPQPRAIHFQLPDILIIEYPDTGPPPIRAASSFPIRLIKTRPSKPRQRFFVL